MGILLETTRPSRQELENENARLRRQLAVALGIEEATGQRDLGRHGVAWTADGTTGQQWGGRSGAKQQALCSQEPGFMRQIVESSPNLIWVQDHEGRIVYYNRAVCDLLNIAPGELVGAWPCDPVDPDSMGHNALGLILSHPGQFGEPTDTKIMDATGQVHWLRTHRVPVDVPGNPQSVLCVAFDITEQRQAREELAESEAFLRTAIDLIPSSLYVKDHEGRHILANRELGRVFGVPSDEILGKDDHDLLTEAGFPLSNLTLFSEQDRQVRETGQQLDIKREQVEMPDGTSRWFEARKLPLTWRGQPGMILGITTDITDRVEATRALWQSERVLRQVLDTNPSMIFVKDPDGRYVVVNRTYAEVYGMPADELLGRTDLDFAQELGMPAEQSTRYRAQDERVRRTGQSVSIEEERHTSPDGAIHWLSTTKTPLTLGGQTGHVLGVSHDITEMRQMMQALGESEALLRAVMDADPNHVYLKDPEGRYVLANQAMAARFGLEPKDVLGLTDEMLYRRAGLDPEKACQEAETDAHARASSEPLVLGEQSFLGGDGQETWLQGYKRTITWQDCPGYVLGVMVDVTLRRSLEAQLRQAAKMEAIGRLAGGIAHDFNNLLTVINGYAELIVGSSDKGEDVRQDVGQILEAGYRAADLTKRLLTFSRQQSTSTCTCHLGQTIEQMGRMLRRIIGEDVLLYIDQADDLDLVQADPVQLEQLVVNLVVNARDAMPQGGELYVTVENRLHRHHDTLSHVAAEPGAYVAVSVTDTGHGMAQTVLQHLFEPFFTTKEVGKGTGLGLAMVYGIVTSAGGGIDIVSKPGQGTTVTILLPSVGSGVADTAQPSTTSESERGSETILVIEDQKNVAGIVARMLEDLGYRVLAAHGAQEARSLPWPDVDVDLLLTDVVMPEQSGPELVQSLREIGVDLPVVYMSGHSTGMSQCQDGVEGSLITKPFDIKELSLVIRQALADPELVTS